MKEKHLFFKILLFIISISFMSMLTTVSCVDFKNKNLANKGNYSDTSTTKTTKTCYIFLGDSRFVGMNNAVNITRLPNFYVVANVSQGYKWLEETALDEINNIKDNTNYDKYIIICNLGVNDLGNINKYIDILPLFYEDNTVLYWVSVNPTIDKLATVKCHNIEVFNEKLKKVIPETYWIDTYNYLITDGFKSNDGVHYDNETYTKLFFHIMSYVTNMEYAHNND